MVEIMEKICITMFDRDIQYSEALGSYLSNYHDYFSISILTDTTDLAVVSKEADIILMNEDIYKEREHKKLKGKLIFLTEKNDQYNDLDPDTIPDKIFKYMKAEMIANEIKYIYGRRTGNQLINNCYTGASLLGFYGTCGGVGKSVVSITCARLLALSGKKVLYLNYETIASTKAYFTNSDESKRNISDFIYYLFNKNQDNIASLISNFVFKDEFGVECFYSCSGINEVRKLTFEDNYFFLKSIQEKSGYEYIVIDFSNVSEPLYYKLLAICHKIFEVSDSSPISKLKKAEFREYLEYQDEKVIFPTNISIINKTSQIEQTDENTFVIQYDPESFIDRNGTCEIKINGLFGMGVKKIADFTISGIK